MTLAATDARTSLLAFDLYDNPDTPGTTYSFQEPTPKPHIQVDSTRLTTASMDIATFGVTDDEMIDSDTEVRRDEDFDIDIEVDEAFTSTNPLNFHDHVAMEEDGIDNRPESGADHDDIMIDDDLLQDYDGDVGVSGENVGASSPKDEPGTAHNAPAIPSPAITEEQSHVSAAQSPPAGDNLDHVESLNQQPTQHETAQDDSPYVRETNENTISEDALQDSKHAVDTTWSEGTSATLGEEPSNDQSYVDDMDPATEEQVQEHDETLQSTLQDGEDNYYPHLVVVSYDDSTVCLFPPPEVTSADGNASPFRDLPSEFFIADVSVCSKGLSEMFEALRSVLHDSISRDDELIIEIAPLGLRIGEDSPHSRSISLQQILNVHVQLQHQDSPDALTPVNMKLFTVPRFWKSLEFLSAAAESGKGLTEALNLLNVGGLDVYSGGIDEETHDPVKEEQSFDAPPADDGQTQEEANQSTPPKQGDGHSLFMEQQTTENEHSVPEAGNRGTTPSGLGSAVEQATGVDADEIQSPSGDLQNLTEFKSPSTSTNTSPSTGAPSEKEAGAGENAGEDRDTVPQDPALVTHASSHVDDEEELLEYEDEERDFPETNAAHQAQLNDSNNQPEIVTEPQASTESNPKNKSASPVDSQKLEVTRNQFEEIESQKKTDVSTEYNKVQAHHASPEATSPEAGSEEVNSKIEDDKPSSIPVFGGDDEEGEYEGSDEQQYDSYKYDGANEQYEQGGFEDGDYGIDENHQSGQDIQNSGADAIGSEGQIHGYSHQSFEEETFTATDDQFTNVDVEYNADDPFGDNYEGQEPSGFEGDYLGTGNYDEGELNEFDEALYGGEPGKSDIKDGDDALYGTDAVEMPKTLQDEDLLDDEELIEYAEEENFFEPNVGSTLSPGSHKRVRDDDVNQDGDSEVDENQATKRVRSG